MDDLERKVRAYAFMHDCDLDQATYRVVNAILAEFQGSCEGLYDRLFGKGEDGR